MNISLHKVGQEESEPGQGTRISSISEGHPSTDIIPSSTTPLRTAEDEHSIKVDTTEDTKDHEVLGSQRRQNTASRKKIFGLYKGLTGERHFAPSVNRFDYEQKYPCDPFGEELGENARIWLTYLDEAESYDRDKVGGWKDTIDVLLAFTGLFSAIVSTFVTQSSQNLQQDYTQVSANLLFEMVQLQRAQINGIPTTDIPNSTLTPNSPFKPPHQRVSGKWVMVYQSRHQPIHCSIRCTH